jgi:hypothetical protein
MGLNLLRSASTCPGVKSSRKSIFATDCLAPCTWVTIQRHHAFHAFPSGSIDVLIHQRNLIWTDCSTLASSPCSLATLLIGLEQDKAA